MASQKRSLRRPRGLSFQLGSQEASGKDFGLPNGLPEELLEASARPLKTSSFQLGLLGGLQNGFWKPFGPLGAGF